MRGLALLSLAAVLACAPGMLSWQEPAAPDGPPPAWELEPPPPREGAVVPAARLHRATLENGLRVLVLEDPRLPRAALGVVLRRGVADEPLEQAGLASYTSELLQRGAGERDALAFARAVDALGATLSASAGWDSISVSVAGLSRDLDDLASLLGDAVLRPRFDREEAERLRSQRLAAIERAKDDPATLARWHFARALFPGHRYGLPEEGVPETVARLDAEAARGLHEAFFVPDNAIFWATGDVKRADIERRARELFGAWTGTAPAAAGAAAAASEAQPVVLVDRPDLGQATVLLGHEGIRRTAPDRIAAQLMNEVLGGGGFSSRIMRRVRESEGLAYYAYSGFSMRRDGGVFFAATGTRADAVGRSLGMLLAELERARTEPPTLAEIAHARSQAVGEFALGLETSDALVSSLVDLDVYGLPEDSLDTYRRRVRETSDAEVQGAARAHLHPERAAIVVVGPADVLRPQLEAFGAVDVVEP